MTRIAAGGEASVIKRSSKARGVGWATFPLIGVIAAATADGVRRAAAWHGSAELWHVLDPWLPTIIPAHAGYTVDPWPMHIWLSLLVALGLALATFSTVVICVVRSRPWWLRAILLWGSFILVAVGIVGVAQLGEWILHLETFGGLGGSFVRTFTVPALGEAVRWGVLWGWIPALLTSLTGVPRPSTRNRKLGLVTCTVLGVAAVVACAFLATATYGASLSARTEIAQPNGQPQAEASASPEPTDAPPVVATVADPDFPGRCAQDDVAVSIAGFDAATGSRYLAIETRNTSSAPCDLNGLPDVAFASEDGNAIYPSITPREVTPTGEAIPNASVTLEPGSTARADLVWRAPTGRPSEITILMAPWAGAERVAETETLDIVNGAEMALTRWYEDGTLH